MNFFEHQDRARSRSNLLIILFGIAVAALILAVYFPVEWFLWGYTEFIPRHPLPGPLGLIIRSYPLLGVVSATTIAIVGISSWLKIRELSDGGHTVAHMMGARLIEPDTKDPQEKKLLNVVEEMAIAARIPVPNIYMLDREFAINAFAAGFTKGDAIIGVTRGTVDKLSRDQLQGVIAHEFSHILHGDMKLNIQLIGLLHGIFVIHLIGRSMIHGVGRSHRVRVGSKRGNINGPILGFGIALMIIGWIGYIFGRIIQAAVSRQREFLADASAVQYTRNPDGIGQALKIIAGYGNVPAAGSHLLTHRRSEISHMTFGNVEFGFSNFDWLSSHPNIERRIRAIDKHFDPSKVERQLPLPGVERLPFSEGDEPLRKIGVEGYEVPVSPKLKYTADTAFQPIETVGIAAAVGTISGPAITAEKNWLEQMDPVVYAACHDTEKAKAVIYVLASDFDEQQNESFRRILEIRDPKAVPDFTSLFGPIKKMGIESRLKLIDVSIPALRKLGDQNNYFFRTLADLIQADRGLSLFEFLLMKIVRKHLKDHAHPKRKPSPSIVSLYTVRNEIAVVLAMIAKTGYGTSPSAEKAFAYGLKSVLPRENPDFSAIRIDLTSFNEALKKLSDTTFPLRNEILNACLKTILTDKQMSAKEAELLRAIADTLDCPIPSLSN